MNITTISKAIHALITISRHHHSRKAGNRKTFPITINHNNTQPILPTITVTPIKILTLMLEITFSMTIPMLMMPSNLLILTNQINSIEVMRMDS